MKRALYLLGSILSLAILGPAMTLEPVAVPRIEPATIKWRSEVIHVALSDSLIASSPGIKSDSDVFGAIRRSLAAWETAAGVVFQLENSERQSISPSGVSGDGVSLITIAQTPENVQLFSRDPFGESALTRVFYNRRGSITEADIVLNPFQQFSTDGTYGTFDLETTLNHEIGHLLGLRHSFVPGSIMAERIPRNGDIYAGPRVPSEADVAAIRDLYNVDTDQCCGVIRGRLNFSEKSKDALVWAQDALGRVAAQAQASTDGTYRLAGLPEGKYEVFWERHDRSSSASGSIGTVSVEQGIPRTLSKRIDPDPNDLVLGGIGFSPRDADPAVALKPGRTYTLYLAGTGLDRVVSAKATAESIRVESIQPIDGSQAVVVTIDREARPGVYSLFVSRSDSARSVQVGCLIVQ